MIPAISPPPLLPENEEKHLANERDVALMARVGQGDVDAFQALVEIHQHSVVGTISKMLGAPWEAGRSGAAGFPESLEISATLSAGRAVHDLALHDCSQSRLQ